MKELNLKTQNTIEGKNGQTVDLISHEKHA